MSFDQPVLLPSSAIPRLPSSKQLQEAGLIRSLEFTAFENALTVPGTLARPLVSRASQPWKISAWRVLSQTNEVEQAFCQALEAGTHHYVHQTELGVGASKLLQHLMLSFNATQKRLAAHPMQVCYLSLGKHLSVSSKLLDALGTTIKFPTASFAIAA